MNMIGQMWEWPIFGAEFWFSKFKIFLEIRKISNSENSQNFPNFTISKISKTLKLLNLKKHIF